ncbi:MAG: zinc transporter ZupT [Planctomycetes bacterium]|nr:zinc transporter ZupT [Planctomycetota bacterium]
METSGNVAIAFGLTLLAGLSTGIGSAIAYFIRRPKIVYLSFSLGLSGGVMVYVSFMELLPDAADSVGEPLSLLFFFAGIAFIGIVDLLVPQKENPHNLEGLEDPKRPDQTHALTRTGVMTALAIAIHNFPEGLAVFASALSDPRLGLFIAIAIAIHNIPEGIAVSMPILYATGNKNKAFFYSFFSGMSEPAGALVGYLLLMPFLNANSVVLAGTLAFVAGVMVYISFDELLPMAHSYGHGHLVISGVVLGMLLMALSLMAL